MSKPNLDLDKISVRTAQTPEEIQNAQKVRYQVFYEEHQAIPSPDVTTQKRDFDIYDDYADHLIVIDHTANDQIVGTYRLLNRQAADKCGQFYTSNEFDIGNILKSGHSVLELGRSCVLPAYRTRPVLQLLWQGIADYITDRNIDLLFGCASLNATNIDEIATPLSYLYHFHLAEDALRPKALDDRYINMNIIPKDQLNPKACFAALPPLIKGYLRAGGMIGDGAVIDHDFRTTDVCILLQTEALAERYRNHYERKIQRAIPTGGSKTSDMPATESL